MYQRCLDAVDPSTLIAWNIITSCNQNKDKLGIKIRKNFPSFIGHPSRKKLRESGISENRYLAEKYAERFEEVKKKVDASIEKAPPDLPQSEIEKNISFLADSIGLTDIQRKLLLFFADFQFGIAKNLLGNIRDMRGSHDDYYEAIAFLIDEEEEDVRRELSPTSILVGMEFIKQDTSQVETKIGYPIKKDEYYKVHPDTAYILEQRYADPAEIIALYMGDITNGFLTLEANYGYMQDNADDMLGTLNGFLEQGHRDFKIVTLAGDPGTGKTELTGALSKAISELRGAEIPFYLNGDPHKPNDTNITISEPTREER